MTASMVSLLLLAFAVSLDGFGVGITYGVRKIKIPFLSILIISICSGLVILLSMRAGVALSGWMSPHAASVVGAVILIGIGIGALVQFVRGGERRFSDGYGDGEHDEAGSRLSPNRNRDAADEAFVAGTFRTGPEVKLELKLFGGFMIQILRTPSAADLDRSGTISAGEAFLLGTALSLDALGAGIGAAMVGFQSVPTALLIAAASGALLWSGTRFGFRVSGWRWVRQLSMLPGLILIAMGIFKLF